MPTYPTRTWRGPRSRASSRHRSRYGCGRAFTLLELLVVITVLALLAVVVVTRLGGARQRASFEQALGQWEFVDQQLRTHARRTNRPVELRLELGTGRLGRVTDPDRRNEAAVQTLAGGVRVARYMSPTRDTESGVVRIAYRPDGTSESFAVKVASGRERQKWILVAGVTGQTTRMEKENEVEDILRSLTTDSVYAR